MKQRPLPVTVIAWVYIVVGVAGFASHVAEFGTSRIGRFDVIGVELIRLIAVVAGIYMLRAGNWARWLAVAWIGFHVVLSAFHSRPEFAMHVVICAGITWLLFRRDASVYFQG
jgi:hypothetical protein